MELPGPLAQEAQRQEPIQQPEEWESKAQKGSYLAGVKLGARGRCHHEHQKGSECGSGLTVGWETKGTDPACQHQCW